MPFARKRAPTWLIPGPGAPHLVGATSVANAAPACNANRNPASTQEMEDGQSQRAHSDAGVDRVSSQVDDAGTMAHRLLETLTNSLHFSHAPSRTDTPSSKEQCISISSFLASEQDGSSLHRTG